MLLLLLLACVEAQDKPPTAEETGGALPVDADGDGYAAGEDCDDDDANVHPDASESCDGVDEDCDDEVDEDLRRDWYVDADGDGFGAGTPMFTCDPPAAASLDGRDCDDGAPTVHPAAEELCNGVDDNCDGSVDDGVELPTWYADLDADGYGADTTTTAACAPGAGWSLEGGDCDDADPDRSPGLSEVCNTLDDDCSGLADDNDAYCPCSVEYYLDTPYLFCTTGSEWATARDACETTAYTLVTVSDASEDAWLSSTAGSYGSGYWWTGATDLASERAWEWASGESWSYQNWCSGEPNNSHGLECVATAEEDCGVLSWGSGGCWNDYPCTCSASQGEPYRYICEG